MDSSNNHLAALAALDQQYGVKPPPPQKPKEKKHTPRGRDRGVSESDTSNEIASSVGDIIRNRCTEEVVSNLRIDGTVKGNDACVKTVLGTDVSNVLNGKLAAERTLTLIGGGNAVRRGAQRSLSRKTRRGMGAMRKLKCPSRIKEVESELSWKHCCALNSLWCVYATALLKVPVDAVGSSSDVTASKRNVDDISSKIVKMDLTGAPLRIVRTRQPSCMGTEGIIIRETASTFTIARPQQPLAGGKVSTKLIPKRESVFVIPLCAGAAVTLFGNNFMYRPWERATRKFKAKSSIEL